MSMDDQLFRLVNHLDLIEAGAKMCHRHARQLVERPSYETWAEHHMRLCEVTLRASLITVRRARAVYQRKRVDQ